MSLLHAEPLPTDKNELITKVVPWEYHDFFNVFSCKEAKLMPPHQPYDHTIDLENDQMPPHSHIYPLSGTELSTLRKFLDDMLGKGFIRSSSLRLSMGYGFGWFNPQVPEPEPTGSGNPKVGYLPQPKPMDVGLDFGRHRYLPQVPGFQY